MRRSVLVLALSALIALPSAAAAMGGYADMPSTAPVINRAEGDVAVKPSAGKDWNAARIGMLLSGGDAVKTGGDGRAEILHGGGAIRLFPNSQLLIPTVKDEGGAKAIGKATMDQGAGVFRASPRGVKGGFEVQTLQVIAGVKGTLFSVKASKKMSRVAVYRGVVEVTDTSRTPSTTTMLYRGQYIEVEDGKGFGAKKGFTPGDPWGDWRSGGSEPSLDDRRDFTRSQGVSSGYHGYETQ